MLGKYSSILYFSMFVYLFYLFVFSTFYRKLQIQLGWNFTWTVHEITAGHRSLSGMISCVTGRIRFLLVTMTRASIISLAMTNRFSNFNSISYTNDRHELQVTGTKCQLPDTMSGTSKIFISGTENTICLSVCMFVRNRLPNHAYYSDEAFICNSMALG